MRYLKISILLLFSLISACRMGPDYVRPGMSHIPATYKELPKNWKRANPQDGINRGNWWEIFHDAQLNRLETQLNKANQTIAIAYAQYQQSLALVDEARANYFPTISTAVSINHQRQGGFNSSSSNTLTASNANSNSNSTSSPTINTLHLLSLTSSWEPDIWGSVSRNVEANKANAEATAALLAVTQLSMQTSLAQDYFSLRALDTDQQLLDNSVRDYQKALQLTKNRYNAGVAGLSDVVQARTQLESAQAQAINNRISRAQFEHAIAVLLGQAPATFAFAAQPLKAKVPSIPVQVPSALLERRPDIAVAERKVAQANAQIGVAIAAYFPVLSLSGSAGLSSTDLTHLFTLPALSWAVGSQLAETLFDGGLRQAVTAAARANYRATVATYRQTVLSAFQEVEDNLTALTILSQEVVVQNRAAADAKLALKLMTNQYKAGTVAYSEVITAQITAYSAEKTAADIQGLRMTAAVGLIKALGGGWR